MQAMLTASSDSISHPAQWRCPISQLDLETNNWDLGPQLRKERNQFFPGVHHFLFMSTKSAFDTRLSTPATTMAEPFATLTIAPIDLEAGGSDAPPQRLNRRAHLAPELLRSRKLAAGEWVLLKASGPAAVGEDNPIGWVVAQLWPRVGIEEDSGLR